MNGFAGDCPNGGFTLESPIYNGTVSQPIFVLQNVSSSELKNFGGTFTNNCTGQSEKVQASFKLPENNSLVLWIDAVSLRDGGALLKNESSIFYPNMLSKPEEGGSLLFTLFNLTNFNETTSLDSFTSTDYSGELVAHVLRNSNATTLGYLDKFEVETKGEDIIFSVEDKKAPLQMQQGATYVLLINGDLKKVSPSLRLKLLF